MKRSYIFLAMIMMVYSSCDECTPILEVRNSTNMNLTVYYNWNTLQSFGVGPMDTVKFAMNGGKTRTIRAVEWYSDQNGNPLIVKQEEVFVDCKDTYILLIEP